MDRRERLDDPEEALRAAMDGRQSTMWTALPGIVQSFDPSAVTCVVQPAIKGVINKIDGSADIVNLPLLLDCPVVFSGGGGATLTFPLTAGDECLVVFASRCIDAWWQQGGVQPPMELRMHSLSDGYAIPGVRSQPRKITVGAFPELRSDDGLTLVRLNPAGQVVTIKAPGGIVFDSPVVSFTGSAHATGMIVADGGFSP